MTVRDDLLSDCICTGRDYAGTISFDDLVEAIRSKRFKILSVRFVGDKSIHNMWLPAYEVVLRAER